MTGGADGPDAFRVIDDLGKVVTMMEMRADGYSHHDAMPLVNGRSGVVTVTTDAAELQFLRDGAVVDTAPIAPLPGQPLRVRR